ncbi:hypothetical protein Droror1_Dr00012049 [Drosera rotundifolia]
MNGKKGGMESNIPITVSSKNKLDSEKCENALSLIQIVCIFCKEDVNRVIFSLKVGLAVFLVALLILIQAPYEVFGANIIWSIITVAVMFEYTVGMTFNRGFNRALGSLFAGILAICTIQLALCMGEIAEPIVIGVSIFLVGVATSFLKLWPSLVQYEYGFRVVLFTFCLIIVSGYRMGNPIRTAMDRLYSIAMGGFVAVFVNTLILPIWAGEQLHKELIKSFEAVADSLEECVRKYLEDDGSDGSKVTTALFDEFLDEPAYKQCLITVNASTKLETLANAAKWEPPHGKFNQFFYPWSEYVKVGSVLRYCAYEVMALHGVLHSEIQAPHNLRLTFQSEIHDAASQAAELVRSLGKDIGNMKRSLQSTSLKRVHSLTDRLQHAINVHSYLLTSIFEPPPDGSSPYPQPKLLDVHIAIIGPDQDLDSETPVPLHESSTQRTVLQRTDSYHDMMRKQSRRLHSWPSRELDSFKEEGGATEDLLLRMRAVERTTSLSVATFASLLIEFVARLDHLVEAVEDLSRLAKFKDDCQ